MRGYRTTIPTRATTTLLAPLRTTVDHVIKFEDALTAWKKYFNTGETKVKKIKPRVKTLQFLK